MTDVRTAADIEFFASEDLDMIGMGPYIPHAETRDMTDETPAKCIYVGMSAGIAGPLLTTPGADFDDDRELAARAGYVVGSKRTTSS